MPDERLIGYPPNAKNAPIRRGKNYVLAIAINDYKHCPKLNNAVKDVRDFIALITSKYQFDTENITTLFDSQARRRHIVRAFHHLAQKITADDNLIIYFSGHGEFDSVLQQGYWIPVDAENNEIDDYLPNSTIKDTLNAINSHHTLLIADSCFSETLFSSRDANRNISQRLESESSRWGLTSGRNEIVSDGAPNTNSPFAEKLLHLLIRNEKSLGSAELCAKMMEIVAANARQTPRGEPLQIKGHNGGQFFFHLKATEKSNVEETPLSEIESLRKRLNELENSINEKKVNFEIPTKNNIVLASIESNGPVYLGEPPFEFEPLETIRFENNLPKIITPPTIIIPKKFDFEPEMVFVEGGAFKMGNNSYKKGLNVSLSDFYIGKFPVIQSQWEAIMGNNFSLSKRYNLPIETVSWEEVQIFIEKLNWKTNKKYRLPTEAEWEFAARGGIKSLAFAYSGSDNAEDVAWFSANSGNGTHPVGQLKSNELDIFDMSGNVWEWCDDWHGEYIRSDVTNPTGLATGIARIYRGGSWISNSGECNPKYRGKNNSDFRFASVGFRLAISI